MLVSVLFCANNNTVLSAFIHLNVLITNAQSFFCFLVTIVGIHAVLTARIGLNANTAMHDAVMVAAMNICMYAWVVTEPTA